MSTWKWRLVMMMMVLCGLSLGIFISIFWPVFSRLNLQQFDAEMKAEAMRGNASFMEKIHLLNRPDNGFMPPERGIRNDFGIETAYAYFHSGEEVTLTNELWDSQLDVQTVALRIKNHYKENGIEYLPILLSPPHGPGSDGDRWSPTTDLQRPPPRPGGIPFPDSVYLTFKHGGESWRIMGVSDGVVVVLAAKSLQSFQEELYGLRRALMVAVPVTLFILGLAVWFFSIRAIAPVERMQRVIKEIHADSLSVRLPVSGEATEFADLINGYNKMLDRLEKGYLQAKRFSADAAHELNTPLTILNGHLDQLLQEGNLDSDAENQVLVLLDETRRLEDIISKLLLLSQADSGRLFLEKREFSFTELVEEIMEDAVVMAPQLQIEKKVPSAVFYEGDRGMLRQCLFNLISNAIKYNTDDGYIRVSLIHVECELVFTVSNSGERISEMAEGHIFERFYRGDPSRNSNIPGLGLGLSLAYEFAKAHGGRLALTDNRDGLITFQLTLPTTFSKLA